MITADYRDRRSGRPRSVEIPLGTGVTRALVEEMDEGNLFKYSRISTALREFVADVYHEPKGGARGCGHLQNVINEVEGWVSYRTMPPDEEMERLKWVARQGLEVKLSECHSFNKETGVCPHGEKCRHIHYGETARDSSTDTR